MRILHDESLQRWHTLASDTKATCLIIIETLDDLEHINYEDIIIGGGSNIVFLDNIQSRLAHMAIKGVKCEKTAGGTTYIKAMAGENWHQFVSLMVAQGLGGIENLALIPGTVGAAPVQNIGAYGVEVSDCITEVEVYDRLTRQRLTLSNDDCGFAYRQSNFKTQWQKQYVIVSVTFALKNNPKLNLNYAGLKNHSPPLETIKEVFDAVVQIRTDKLPDPAKLPNAGSFFHNPIISAQQFKNLAHDFPLLPSYAIDREHVKIPAAWLIEACGLKGYREGGVGIYDKHALILVNYHGNGRDIKQFADKVICKVKDKFGITLNIEPRIIGT